MPQDPLTPVAGARATSSPAPAAGRPATWDDLIDHYAQQEGIPPALARAVAMKESTMRPGAVGDGGQALGFFQLHDAAAQDAGIADRADPVQNIQGGVKYLRQLKDRYKGDVSKMLMAYNGGMKWVDEGAPTPQAQAYAADVLTALSKGMRERAAGAPVAGQSAPAAPAPAADPALARAAVLQKLAGTRPMGSHGPMPAAAPGGSQPAGSASQVPEPSLGDTASNIGWDLAQGKVGQAAKTAWDFATTGVNPMTRTGRENIAGMIGETAGVLLGPGAKAPGMLARAGRALIPPAVAGLTAAGETVAENALTGSAHSPAEAATDQTAYALGGQALLWPIKRVGRAVLGTRVADEAASAIHQQGRAIADRAAGITAAARTAVDDLSASLKTKLSQITTAATQAQRSVAARGTAAVSAAKGKTAQALADLDLAASDAQATHTRALNDLLSGGGTQQTVDATRAVLDGPAKRALDAAGKEVAASAEDGPPIAVEPLQAALREMLEPARPPSMYPVAEPPNPVGFSGGAPVRARTANDLVTASSGRIKAADYQAAVNGIAQTAALPAEHPLPDILRRFLAIEPEAPAAFSRSAGGTIPFKELHQIKKLLDDSINFDARSKKVLDAITKGFRGKVRQALAVHEPYNVANAAYQEMVRLQTKGLGKRLAQHLATPGGEDAAARMLKNNNPIAARTLRDLLVGQAAAGGDRAAGQRAWDAARASWAHDNLFSAGIDGLGERLSKLEAGSPEFLKIVGSDPAGQQILANAKRLAQAVEAGKAREAQTKQLVTGAGTDAVATAKAAAATGKNAIVGQAMAAKTAAQSTAAAATSTVRQKAAAALANARADADTQRTTRQALSRARPKLTQDDAIRDLFHVASYGPGSAFGVAPLWRLLRGPQRDAIMEWAAYSTPNTQRLVNALERPQNPQIAAGLIRDISAFVQQHLAAQQQQTATSQAHWDTATKQPLSPPATSAAR